MTTNGTGLPPRSGTLETTNGTATISRSPREGVGDDMVVVEYRDARVHITRDPRAVWRIRVMNIGKTFTDSAPKLTGEGECVLLAIKAIDRVIKYREELASYRKS